MSRLSPEYELLGSLLTTTILPRALNYLSMTATIKSVDKLFPNLALLLIFANPEVICHLVNYLDQRDLKSVQS